MLKPLNLKCEYLREPLGIDTLQPRFSWTLQARERGARQTAYQIVVSSSPAGIKKDNGDKWDSGRVSGDSANQVEYRGTPLASGERCYWKVRVWDQNDRVTQYSEVSCFEMGLLRGADWTGRWIGGDAAAQSPLFRKTFSLNRELETARAYICGLGYYELYLNGQKVGDHLLDPNWTDYDTRALTGLLYPFADQTTKTVLYVSYDITAYCRQGENAVGVILGNGWYNQRDRKVEGDMHYDNPKMILQLVFYYSDGNRKIIASDGSWKTALGPIVYNNIYYGETYDARLEQEGWSNPGYEDSAWNDVRLVRAPAGELRAQLSPPDKAVRKVEPVRVSMPQRNFVVYDMGETISGWIKIRVRGKTGLRLVMRYAEEMLPDGNLNFQTAGSGVAPAQAEPERGEAGGPPNAQIQTDVYILKGSGSEAYQPRFTWHGFRYVEIGGDFREIAIEAVQGVVVHAAVEITGSFVCSNGLFNAIQQNCVRTFLDNFHGGVPGDCPHRERLGYTGDGQITACATIYNFDMARFYTKWLRDIKDAQNKESGFVPHTAPFAGGGGGPAWGCASVLIPWYMYLFYSDRRILEDHYQGMKHWMAYLSTRTDDGCMVEREEPGGWCLGDWCTPGRTEIPEKLVNTFYFGYCAQIMAKIARVLCKSMDAAYFSNLEAQIAAAFNKEFLNEASRRYSIGRQGTELFPLRWGIVPDGLAQGIVTRLASHLEHDCGAHLDTGIFATAYLWDILTDYGRGDLAYKMLNQPDYPSYGYMIANGATTLWECWEKDMNWYNYVPSHCHPMFGSVSAWFFSRIAGIRPDEQSPGFKKIVVCPDVPGDLTYVKASVASMFGVIRVSWEASQADFRLTVAIPVNCSAVLMIPKRGKGIVKIFEGGLLIWDGYQLLATRWFSAGGDDGRYVYFFCEAGEYIFVAR